MMADLKSMEPLIEEVTTNVRGELLQALKPAFEQLAATIAEIEQVLGGGTHVGNRTSRTPAQVKETAVAYGPRKARTRTAAEAPATPSISRGRAGNNPPGLLQEVLKRVLSKATSPLRLRDIQLAVLADSQFKDRKPQSVYMQVLQGVRKLDGVIKNPKGLYSLKSRK